MNNLTDRRIKVKVCGITRLSDAEALDALKIDYLGFNFHPKSKRYVEPRKAAEMIARLKNAEPVGVFVDVSPEHIAEVAATTGIRWIQLHGNESWDVLKHVSLPVIKAIPHVRINDFGGLRTGWNEHGDKQPRYFLVDTQADSEFGGSGKAFDWSLLKSNPLPCSFFLAGGLGPENLGAALKTVTPYAVDLNSKVETAPGIKDVELVLRCQEIVG